MGVSLSALALACAVCGAAEQTLPANGAEIAFKGRVRATVDARAGSFAARERALEVTEVRVVPGMSATVTDTTTLALDVPLLQRTVAGAAHGTLGDAEARATYSLRRETRRLSLFALVKAPTSPIERDPNGAYVPTDLQPGCGSVMPGVGATFAFGPRIFSAWTTVSFLLPVRVRGGPHPGRSVRASFSAQVQPLAWLAFRAGAHGRFDSSGDIDGVTDARSGGGSLHLAPEIVVSPVTDLVLSVGVAVPAVQEMRGYRATSPVALASIGYDF
jgi:hypothetical protein